MIKSETSQRIEYFSLSLFLLISSTTDTRISTETQVVRNGMKSILPPRHSFQHIDHNRQEHLYHVVESLQSCYGRKAREPLTHAHRDLRHPEARSVKEHNRLRLRIVLRVIPTEKSHDLPIGSPEAGSRVSNPPADEKRN